MSPDMVFALPATLWIVLVILATLVVGLVFFALYSKGDVSAEFSHGLTSLKLEAKDRVAQKGKTASVAHLPRPHAAAGARRARTAGSRAHRIEEGAKDAVFIGSRGTENGPVNGPNGV